MKKAFFAILMLGFIVTSCHKGGMIGCDPGPGGGMQKSFDIAFYRGNDNRAETDYIAVDGGALTAIPSLENETNVSCSSTGLLHYTLALGTHTYTIHAGTGPNSGIITYSLVLSANGATVNGQTQPLGPCNGGLSLVVADM